MTTKRYIGAKQVLAYPLTRQGYMDARAWVLPANENGADEGYLLGFDNEANPGVLDRSNIITWLPKAEFEAAYRPVNQMSFGLAIEALKLGKRVARAGWNGKGMWLMYISGKEVRLHRPEFAPRDEHDHNWRDRVPTMLPWIGMKTADGKFVPWLASQTDVLADDWTVVE